MNTPIQPPEPIEYLFIRSGSAAAKGTWFLVGGFCAIVFAGLGFAFSLVARVDQITMHAITTMPTILGLGAITAGYSLIRAPKQVFVGTHGIAIDGKGGRRSYSWDQIGWVKYGSSAEIHRRHLILYDTSGKTIATISDAFQNFDTLVALVRERVAAKQEDVSERIRTKKARSMSLVAVGTGVLMAAAGGGVAWHTYAEQRAARVLQELGVPQDAELVRRFVAPNGVTRRIEYRVTTPNGKSATRNAEVQPAYWHSLEGVTTVPVIAVPNEPAISRLVIGEVEEDDLMKTPVGGYGLSILGAIMSLFMFGAAVMLWLGWDISTDSKTGKISIKRFGETS